MCLVQIVLQCFDVNQMLLFITAPQQTEEGAEFGFRIQFFGKVKLVNRC